MKMRANAATDSFDLRWDKDYRVREVVPEEGRTKGTENVWMTEQVPTEDLGQAVVRFLQSGQYERSQALVELIDLSRRGTEPLGGIKSSLNMIFESGIHGRRSRSNSVSQSFRRYSRQAARDK